MLKKLARLLFKSASIINTVGTIASGNPNKIVKHVIRKKVYSKLGRIVK